MVIGIEADRTYAEVLAAKRLEKRVDIYQCWTDLKTALSTA